jgi:5-methyltetrahydrofolate--homocysteine methyltransferase
MLNQLIGSKLLEVKGVSGIWSANSVGDDVEVYHGGDKNSPSAKFCMLRQQVEKEDDSPFLCLSDFIAPKSTGLDDHIGKIYFLFPRCVRSIFRCRVLYKVLTFVKNCVLTGGFTVGIFGSEKLAEEFDAENDPYKKMMVQALADRLAEAAAEYLHRDMRTNTWGYAKSESLDASELLKIKYQGIRPAPGYPSQPDHTEKQTLWKLLDAEKLTGIKLTESLAMVPASSVSALVFAHSKVIYNKSLCVASIIIDP